MTAANRQATGAVDGGGTPQQPSLDRIRELVGAICDPELPPLTLVDLGILRAVERNGDGVVVTVTPTYSGCPAVEYIEDRIREELASAGFDQVRIVRAMSPAWSSDWITPDGHRKLAALGIAPPAPVADGPVPIVLGRRATPTLPCPRCGSTDTEQVSAFGSTACKALNRCNACYEPFDSFKAL